MSSQTDLEGGAASGEPSAQFALGVDILSGPRAAVEGSRGIALIDAAAAKGNADAEERCALFEAMGVGRLPDWERALDRLQRAAEIGSTRAQNQLLLLCDSEDEGIPADAPAEQEWSRIRSHIAVEKLLQGGERRVLSESPRIRAIDSFATAAECRWLIAAARDRLQPAAIFDQRTGTMTQDPARSNRGVEFGIMDMDLVTEIVRTRISRVTRLPLPVFETTQVLHYSVGQEFRPHHDFLDQANPAYRDQIARFGQRIATFLICLNADFEGGETDFPRAGIRYRGKAGDALFFANVDTAGQPDPLTLHAGLPPTSGEKWIFSQWIRDRSPGAGQ